MAPKRHPGCHGSCPEYLKEKAEYDARAAEDYKRRHLIQDLNDQRYRAVTRATKHKRKCKEE
jgi:hypothetical protein